MKTNIRKISLVLALVMVLALSACTAKTPGEADLKTATLTVVHKDGTEKAFEVSTDKQYLGEAFADQNVFTGETGSYGVFITTADGETANDTNEEWWCITKGGAEVMTGIDTTEFADGDKFELTLMVGY